MANGVINTAPMAALKRCWHPGFSELVAREQIVEPPQKLVISSFAFAGDDVVDFDVGLRVWRNSNMARIAAADIAGAVPVSEVLQAVTDVAEYATQAAVRFHLAQFEARYGACVTKRGEPVLMTVLGMGKMGGGELNFSSDIDLIFLYSEAGECSGVRALSAEEFFSKVIKAVSKSLGAVTADGFVFRVDLRLRPFGGTGPLAMHFDQAEHYYETHGRDWERYAFIKARPVAGNIAAGNAFLERLQAFIYRRYLDFTALHGLRDLKQKIEQQYAQKRLEDNVKLGQGGIREIEFIAQSFQLVRGGQHADLQTQSLYRALGAAADIGLVSELVSTGLVAAYDFLRVVENRLQQRADQQVHHLPQAEAERQLLAEVLGFSCWDGFMEALDRHRAFVHEQFFNVLLVEEHAASSLAEPLSSVVQARLETLRASQSFQALSDRARAYAETVLSLLPGLEFSGPREEGQLAILKILDQIWGRTTYLALLAEQPQALNRLAFFVSRSAWMAEQVAEQPHLLDDLLDERAIRELPGLPEKRAELLAQLNRVAVGDLEQAMDVCRRFKISLQFRVAAADVAGLLPVMQVSDHLSELAEVVLQESLEWVAAELQSRTGQPRLRHNGELKIAQLLVVGYGKLGGIELGYGSDLDIVLLHDAQGDPLGTDGPKSLENPVYFQRLGQRFVHFLSANTPAGRLYEIDTRLRPSGASGLLVTSLQAFKKYQQSNAWVWEHQALVRARPVAGPAHLFERFIDIRCELLRQTRNLGELKQEVLAMRNKMRAHLDDSNRAQLNLKHCPGGLVDIEFICQYLVLAYAASSQQDFRVTDNVRQIAVLSEAGILPTVQAEALTAAYLAIRNLAHHQRLGVRIDSDDEDDPLRQAREQVVAIWQELLE